MYRLNAPPGLCLRTKFFICYVHSLFNRVLAHGVDRFLERLALEALLHRLPFSVTVSSERSGGGVVTCEHGFYIFLFAVFILSFRWSSLFRSICCCWWNALGNSHLFLTCSGGGGDVILMCFLNNLPDSCFLLWYGSCSIFQEENC